MTAPLKSIVEALIFVSQEPIGVDKLKGVLTDFSEADIESAAADLVETYAENTRGIRIQRSAGGFLFVTHPECDPWIRKMLHQDRKSRLSPAALETLSIIAYHQPVTSAEVSALRGVDASHALKTLLLKRLIKITGRKKSPGKPLIYRTSTKFLAYFGLNSLEDLPTREEIEVLLEEERPAD